MNPYTAVMTMESQPTPVMPQRTPVIGSYAGYFEAQQSAIIMLDRLFNVIYLNSSAEHLLALADGLSLQNNHLLVKRSGATVPLARYFRRPNTPGEASVKRLARPSGKRPYLLQLISLAELPGEEGREENEEAFAATYLLCIADPQLTPEVTEEQLQLLFGFTKREATLTRLIIRGGSVEEIAHQLDVSINTVRFHLRSVFRKTETSSQIDLLRLLLSVPLLKTIHLNES